MEVGRWKLNRRSVGGVPAVVFADLDHGGEDVVPRLLLAHDRVGEHATIPADVFDLLRDLARLVAQPVAGVAGDVELAAWIGGEAVAAGLLVIAGAEDGAVVLRDVEVDRPRTQGVRSI